MLTLVIPSRNNFRYVYHAYNNIRDRLGKDLELVLLDDASTDLTWKWMNEIATTDQHLQIYRNTGPERVGHTVLYDVGAHMARTEIFGIFHADMLASPNYVDRMLSNVQRGVVISATRVEPPLHPPGPEKYVIDFGMEPEVFNWDGFLAFIKSEGEKQYGKTTQGIFAPWIMYKDDFFAIGGHDKRVFAPMELEDSDLFNRFLLKGYHLRQQRDAFVYHMTCRGSRFKDGIKIIQEIPVGPGQVWKRSQDSEEYTKLRQNKFREWWRKWHMDVLHDVNMLPIVNPRYNTGFVVTNCPYGLIPFIEPWCDTLFIESEDFVQRYISEEQPHTKFDLSKRILPFTAAHQTNDITIHFDGSKFTQQHMETIKQLPLMIQDSGERGVMEFDIFQLDIQHINPIQDRLIHADDPWYVEQLYGNNTNQAQ